MAGYSLKFNKCQGWVQGIYHAGEGRTTESAKFPTQDEAVAAIRHHFQHSRWPREEEERPVKLCPECGRPLED